MATVLIVVLLVIVLGAAPPLGWHQLGWGPSGMVGLVLVLVLVLLLLGKL